MGNENVKEEFHYEDGDSWHGSKDGLGIKEISLSAFQKAMREGSKEMTQGGVFSRYVDGELVQFAIPNQREIFINSVEMTHIVVKPHIMGLKENVPAQKIVKDMFDKIGGDLKEVNDSFNKQKDNLDLLTENRGGAMEHKVKMNLVAEYNNGLTDLEAERETAIVKVYHDLLSAISFLLNHIGYFEEKGMTGGA